MADAPTLLRASNERPAQGRSLSMLANSLSLIGGKAAAMGLAFAFWVVAARAFEPSAVGIAGAAVSAMMLCTQLAILGIGAAMIAYLPRELSRPAPILDSAFTAVGSAALVAGMAFVAIAWLALGELRVVATTPGFAVLFVAAALFGTIGILLDQVSIAVRRSDQVLARSFVFGGTMLGAAALATGLSSSRSSVVLFACVTAAGLASCALGFGQLRARLAYGYRPAGASMSITGDLFRVGVPNYVLTLAERAPGLILPIVVTELLSPELNAVWYVIWMAAWALYFVPVSTGLTLFAEASHRPRELRGIAERAIRSTLAIGIPGALVLAAAAPLALGFLGSTYEDGITPLRVLALGVVPLGVIHAYYGAARAREQTGGAIALAIASGVASVTAAALAGNADGLTAMALAWLAVQTAAGVWAGLSLRRLLR